MRTPRFVAAIVLLAAFTFGLAACKSAHLAGGKLHFDQKRFERAREQFELAIEEQPENGEAHLWLGRALAELGEAEKADAEFAKAEQLDPRLKEDVWNSRGHYWSVHHNAGVALRNKAMEEKEAGETEQARQDFEAALKEFQTAIIYDPTREKSLMLIGSLYYELGEVDKAIETFQNVRRMAQERAATAADPTEAREMEKRIGDLLKTVYWSLGDQAYQDKDWDGAISFYLKALEFDPENPDLLYQMGGSYYQKANAVPEEEKPQYLEKAVEYYGKVVERVANDEDALYNVTVALFELGRYDEALEKAKALVDVNPKEGDYRILLGRIYSKLNEQEHFVTEYIMGKALLEGRKEPPRTARDTAQDYGPGTDILKTLRRMGEPEEIRRFTLASSNEEYVCWFYWSQGKAMAFVNGELKFTSEFKPMAAGS
jgi:tetratricopeptide (TPR) repeat protein